MWLCLHSIIYKYWPISTKLGQNVCDHKISDEFDYGSNRTRTVRVICPWIRKFAKFGFDGTLASANIDQSVLNLATIYHGGESCDTTTTTMTDIWKKSLTSGKKIFNNSVNTWPIGIWFEAEKAEGLQGFAWCVRFFKQHLIKKLLTSKQIFYPG